MPMDDHDPDDERDGRGEPRVTFADFDCPVCNANNPYDEPFGDGDEVRCFYCGQEFEVRQAGARRFRLREV